MLLFVQEELRILKICLLWSIATKQKEKGAGGERTDNLLGFVLCLTFKRRPWFRPAPQANINSPKLTAAAAHAHQENTQDKLVKAYYFNQILASTLFPQGDTRHLLCKFKRSVPKLSNLHRVNSACYYLHTGNTDFVNLKSSCSFHITQK